MPRLHRFRYLGIALFWGKWAIQLPKLDEFTAEFTALNVICMSHLSPTLTSHTLASEASHGPLLWIQIQRRTAFLMAWSPVLGEKGSSSAMTTL